jgi:hypothetical protein
MTRMGVARKGCRSKGCRGVERGQTCTEDCTGAVALRAALESAVQLGRGHEMNRQAEVADTTKCRDSLQARLQATTRCNVTATSISTSVWLLLYIGWFLDDDHVALASSIDNLCGI